MCGDAFLRLHHLLVKHFRQHDVALKKARSCLVSDAQRVTKTLCRDKQSAVALALQQGIGGHRRAHLHAVHQVGGDGLISKQAEQAAYAFHGSVGVLLRVVRQQLERVQLTAGRAPHHVGEGAASVDPELPAWVCVHGVFRCVQFDKPCACQRE